MLFDEVLGKGKVLRTRFAASAVVLCSCARDWQLGHLCEPLACRSELAFGPCARPCAAESELKKAPPAFVVRGIARQTSLVSLPGRSSCWRLSYFTTRRRAIAPSPP